MARREYLHELIDKVPEAALERAERFLQNIQNWDPKPPIEFEEMHKRAEERLAKAREELAVGSAEGVIGGHHISSHSKPDSGDRAVLMSTSEGETLVNLEIRIFRGHRLELEERLRLSDGKKLLLYSQQIKGPNGKEGRYEIEFAVDQSSPS